MNTIRGTTISGNELPKVKTDSGGFYAAVNTFKLALAHGWCPPGTVATIAFSNPDDPEMDMVFTDDATVAAGQLIARLTDDQLLEILSKRFGSGMLDLPVLDPPTT